MKYSEKITDRQCPVCCSTNILESATYKDNGVIGPGYSSVKVDSKLVCDDCGVMFLPRKRNLIKQWVEGVPTEVGNYKMKYKQESLINFSLEGMTTSNTVHLSYIDNTLFVEKNGDNITYSFKGFPNYITNMTKESLLEKLNCDESNLLCKEI